MKVFIYALFVHLTLNVYVFWRGWQALAPKRWLRITFTSIFTVELLIYLVGLLFHRQLPDIAVHIIWQIGTTWMLFLIYVTLILGLIDLLLYIHKKSAFLPQYVESNRRKARMHAFILSSLFSLSMLISGNYKFNHPVVEYQDITISKRAGDLDSIRIAMVGDMHLGYLIDKKYAQQYVNLIMEQKPDLILIVGDVLDAEIKPIINQRIDEELKQLQAPLGVYGCTGNHEYRFEAEEKIAWLNDEAGITMLRDTAILINNSFYIIGREDLKAHSQKPLNQIIESQNLNTSYPMFVLKHQPFNLEEEADSNVDIALYGHTHRGQVFPGNFYTDLLFEVSHGYKKKNNTNVYVTSGLGLAGPQYRIGTQSEIVILNVKFVDPK